MTESPDAREREQGLPPPAEPRAGRPAVGADAPGSPWHTLAAREIYRNRWLRLTEYAVLRPDGSEGIYSVVDPGDNVTILALDADQQVYLLTTFVYTMQRAEVIAPSGSIDPGEEPEDAARRELREETGITAATWTPLGAYELSHGISTQVSYLYLARDLTFGPPQREATEAMELCPLPLREAYELCLRGEIRSAPTALALWRVWALLHGDANAPSLPGKR